MIKNKHGEDSSTGMILWVIGICVAIVILFLFLFRADLGKLTEQQVCHTSVVMRSTAIKVGDLLKNAAPLNCKTQFICISKDGTCKELTNPEIKKVKDKKEVYAVLASQLVNCWGQFGEGKLDYAGSALSTNNIVCSLCAQVAFDKSIYELDDLDGKSIDSSDFYRYLESTKVPDKNVTYWDYLYEVGSPGELTQSINKKNTATDIQNTCQKFCEYDQTGNNNNFFCGVSTTLTTTNSMIKGTCQAFFKSGTYGVAKCDKSCSSETNSELIITSKETEGTATTTKEICKRFCNLDINTPESSLFCTQTTILTTSTSNVEGTCYALFSNGNYGINECSKSCSSGNSELIITNKNENTNTIQGMCNSLCTLENIDFCSAKTILKTSDFKEVSGSCYALSKSGYINECQSLPCGDNGVNEKLTITPIIHNEGISTTSGGETTVNLGTIDLSKRYYVVMGIADSIDKLQTTVGGAIGTAAIVAVGGIVLFASGGLAIPVVTLLVAAGGGALAGAGAGYSIAMVLEGESGKQFIRPALIEASDEFSKLKCTDVNTLG
jgi:hypothetical protein